MIYIYCQIFHFKSQCFFVYVQYVNMMTYLTCFQDHPSNYIKRVLCLKFCVILPGALYKKSKHGQRQEPSFDQRKVNLLP